RLVVDRHRHLALALVLVRLVEAEIALGADDAVGRRRRRLEADVEGRQLLLAESQEATHSRRDSPVEALVRVPRSERGDLERLGAEEVASGVDAVDADIPDRAAAQLLLRADVVRLHLIGEIGAEEPLLAEAA